MIRSEVGYHVLLACIVACGFESYSSGPGILGAVTFQPKTETQIAVGAQFAVVTNIPTRLVSADTGLADMAFSPRWTVDDSSALFDAKAEGFVSIIAQAREGGTQALDYINVDLRKPDHLSIAYALVASKRLTATMTRDAKPLDGDFGCTWSTSDPSIVALQSYDGSIAELFWNEFTIKNSVDLTALKSGTATITATCLGLTQSITTTVTVDGGASDASDDANDADVSDGDDAGDADDASDAQDD